MNKVTLIRIRLYDVTVNRVTCYIFVYVMVTLNKASQSYAHTHICFNGQFSCLLSSASGPQRCPSKANEIAGVVFYMLLAIAKSVETW